MRFFSNRRFVNVFAWEKRSFVFTKNYLRVVFVIYYFRTRLFLVYANCIVDRVISVFVVAQVKLSYVLHFHI